MPFTVADVSKHTKKAETDKQKRRWVAIANSALRQCIDDGGDDESCAPPAIRQANGVIAKEAEMPELEEALTKNVAGHNLVSSDFLVVEDPDETTTWHLPIKVGGKPDRRLAAAAWAALFSAGGHRGRKYAGPNAAQAKKKLRALYKSQGWDEPANEAEIQHDASLAEGYYSGEPQWSSATTFATLKAQRQVQETVEDLRECTDDLMMMVNNVMWDSTIPQKVPALRSLFEEYLDIVDQMIGSPAAEPEEASDANPLEADLRESASVVSLEEIDVADPAELAQLQEFGFVPDAANVRRYPVLVNFAIIRPGHGNQKNRNYYPAETLQEAGPLFSGVDIFVTDHNEDEKGERTKVGRFRTPGVLTEDGLVSQAIIYDPDQAEKTRNRADAGELGTLHCSIYASGKGRAGTVDGAEVTVIESITAVHSVDLVSRAGAGGRAISLAENIDGGIIMEEPRTEATPTQEPVTETEVQEVEIVESEPETPPAPAAVEDARLLELLAQTDLSDKAKRWLMGRTYPDEAAVQQAIAEMRTFITDLVPAGQPFGLGESAPVATDVPKLLTPAELEERKRQRTLRVLSEIEPSYGAQLIGPAS